MHRKFLIVLLALLSLMIVPFVVQAEIITECAFDKDTYQQGETGYITVAIYNDEEEKIRVTELAATINYYYTDENVYIQKFYAEATLPSEIQPGNSSTFYIPFTLPSNIASGYTNVHVKAVTEIWNLQSERWYASEQHPTSQPTLYIESPYKQQSEDYQQQLEEQQTINQNTTNMMYLFGITTVVFAAVTAFLLILYRRARVVFARPIA